MAHLQYIPGDPRLVDQLVYELKSKGIFDQFRKDCIADVDTRPAYQNLRQRVENSVSTFLARQCWKPDLNKNQLREKLRKHILDGNYLEQGVERIVDQVVNPKVASVFIPQVEDLVYNYLGITRKKTAPVPETSNGKVNDNDLLPTDLEAVSPGSVRSHEDKNEAMDVSEEGNISKMEIDHDDQPKEELKAESTTAYEVDKVKADDTQLSGLSELTSNESQSSIDKSNIPLPEEEINLENIPEPENSPPKSTDVKLELEKIQLPEPIISMDIPLPKEIMKSEKDTYFKPINSDDDDSSSDSSLRRNMSPLTPIRNFNNENSCDAQQAFENDSSDVKCDKKEVTETSFRFTIEAKTVTTCNLSKSEKKDTDQSNLAYQFSSQVTINTFATPMYDDSSNSNLLQIDYESDANSKLNLENKIPESIDQNSDESKKDKKQEEKKSSHKSSHRDRDSHRHSSSKDRRSDSKQSSSRDGKSDRKSSKESSSKSTSKSSHKERSSDRSDRKDSRDSSRHRSSHKSSSHKDSKSHRTSSSSQRYSSSSKQSDERKSSSSSKDKEKSSRDDKYSKEKSSKDSKSSSNSHRSDKDKKSSSSSNKSKHDDKDKKKEKKDTDDHYSASGRGSHSRRSTDRDSNDGSSSSKGSHNPASAKSSESKKENKSSTSKSDNTTTSSESTSPSDKDNVVNELKKSQSANVPQTKPVIRVENHLEVPIASPPRLPFVPDITMRKPKIAANLQEAKKLIKMRKFLDEEQKRMNQEAALLLEFQANVRPSLSQVYSSISGPELEFACVTAAPTEVIVDESEIQSEPGHVIQADTIETRSESISDILNAAEQVENIEVTNNMETEINKETQNNEIDAEVDENSIKATVLIEADESLVQVENIMSVNKKDVNVEMKNRLDTEITERNEPTDINIDSEKPVEVITTVVETTEINAMKIDKHAIVDKEYNDVTRSLRRLLAEKEKISIEVTIEKCSEIDEAPNDIVEEIINKNDKCSEKNLEYFAEHEKYSAELERDKFSKFLKSFTEKHINKMYLINCAPYEEKIIKEVSQNFGNFEIVNYHKNGHLKLSSSAKTIVKNINVSSEITLPLENGKTPVRIDSPILAFSPVKSECSFELSSDYDAKLEEMVSKASRKEIMEIILGSVEESNTDVEMPTIDYCNDSNIESDSENIMKRKFCEVESSENNNRKVLTPNKIRRLSESDQITSTTEETETSNNNMTLNSSTVRSKYLGRARRVGLPRPRRSNLSNSPSSDKSIENYEQNTPVTPNGKIKTQRNKVQRYDTSDLYKPKLHYLSRRNNIS